MASSSEQSTVSDDGPLLGRIQEAIDEVRPMLQSDGGDIELLGLTEEGRARVRLLGACAGCPGAQVTLSLGVQRIVRERVPECPGIEVEGGLPFDLADFE